jgi:hypothetical protein
MKNFFVQFDATVCPRLSSQAMALVATELSMKVNSKKSELKRQKIWD